MPCKASARCGELVLLPVTSDHLHNLHKLRHTCRGASKRGERGFAGGLLHASVQGGDGEAARRWQTLQHRDEEVDAGASQEVHDDLGPLVLLLTASASSDTAGLAISQKVLATEHQIRGSTIPITNLCRCGLRQILLATAVCTSKTVLILTQTASAVSRQ